jgi:hypothetical protein
MTSAQVFREFGVGNSGASGIASACVTIEPTSWSRSLPSQRDEKIKMKLAQRTIKETVYRGESEDEAEEFDDSVRYCGEVARILDLLFIHATSSLSWALLWGWKRR